MFGSWVLNQICIIDLFSALVVMLLSSSKLFLFSNKAVLLELYCVIVFKHVAFFTICAKLTMAFPFTSLPLNFYISVSGCGCGVRFEQKYRRICGCGGKKARIGGFAYPNSPPPRYWLKRLAPLCHLFRSKTKTNRDSLTHVFPRFASATVWFTGLSVSFVIGKSD